MIGRSEVEIREGGLRMRIVNTYKKYVYIYIWNKLNKNRRVKFEIEKMSTIS